MPVTDFTANARRAFPQALSYASSLAEILDYADDLRERLDACASRLTPHAAGDAKKATRALWTIVAEAHGIVPHPGRDWRFRLAMLAVIARLHVERVEDVERWLYGRPAFERCAA